jgi:hypothetical protein
VFQELLLGLSRLWCNPALGDPNRKRGVGVRWGRLRQDFYGGTLPSGFCLFDPTFQNEHQAEDLNSSYPTRNNVNKTSDVLLVCLLVCINEKRPVRGVFVCLLAETEGFEPSMRLYTPYSLSRGAPSATRSRFQQVRIMP